MVFNRSTLKDSSDSLLSWNVNESPASARRCKHSKLRGFTLVETAIALGIASVGLVSILGVLPIGMGASRKASDLTVATVIAQHLANLVYQTGYSNYTNLTKVYYYFDDEGKLIPSSQALTGATYTASVQFSPSPNSIVSSTNAIPLQVSVVSDPAHRLVGSPTELPADMRSRAIKVPVLLADQGN